MIQEIINKIKIINNRIGNLEDQLERLHPSDRVDKSVDFDIDLDKSIELLASSLAMDSESVRTDCSDDVLEYIPESDAMNSPCVAPSADIIAEVPQTTENNCDNIKDTRKQQACTNRLIVLELFAPMASALLTGYGLQYKVWKPGLSSA